MAHYFVEATRELQEQTEAFYKNWAHENRERRRLQQRQRRAESAIQKLRPTVVDALRRRLPSRLKADALKKRRLEAIRLVFGKISPRGSVRGGARTGDRRKMKLADMAQYRARVKAYMDTMTQHGWDRTQPEIIPVTLRSFSSSCDAPNIQKPTR